jgi:iron complex outermembrane recepter protein
MNRIGYFKAVLAGGVSAVALSTGAWGADFDIPAGDLKAALKAYAVQSGVALIASDEAVRGTRSRGAKGELTAAIALSRILDGTGFAPYRTSSGAVVVARKAHETQAQQAEDAPMRVVAAASAEASGVESVVVTSSKIKGDIQTVPIAITALSQEQLTSRQIAGGPDLVKEVPNLTFSKTNFTGYNIQIRGIGTQAISVTTDPAVAVAFNDMPFIRNHFFEQEFYDVSQVEVLRGPQGTLYGRNATAGVVNIVSAKPTDQFEAMLSADIGNYSNRRYEGMINIPVVDDRIDIRAAVEWTKRNGYTFNETTGKQIDGRDLWSSRVTLGFRPTSNLQTYMVWEHFQENDDRLRSGKQLCKKDPGVTNVDGFDLNSLGDPHPSFQTGAPFYQALLSQGCLPASFYSPDSYETPNGQALPFVFVGEFVLNGAVSVNNGFFLARVDPYASAVQSRNLRVIQSELQPAYKAKNDVFEFNADYDITSSLKLTSQTGFNHDQLWSTEDFNRFNTAPGIFANATGSTTGFYHPDLVTPSGEYCDPQLGCSDKMVGEDLSREHAWQFNQEVRLASNFSGPLNFSAGGNFMRYQTVEDYFVFFNLITAQIQNFNHSGVEDFTHCYSNFPDSSRIYTLKPVPFYFRGSAYGSNWGCTQTDTLQGTYIDPHPTAHIDGNGHNYFRSENPYRLLSYAGFGEVYYNVTPDLKFTGGLRWTDDKKEFWDIPSWVFTEGGGYPVAGVVNQQWKEWTGRGVVNWTPKLDFTDQTLVYGSYSRGYKGGGANPPAQEQNYFSPQSFVTHPPTFAPEFVNAYELGSKNTLLDGGITLNGDVFYYDYKGYQISQIVDRTSINLNFDAKVKGAELESSWEPLPGLKFNFAGGYEATSVNKGQKAIDLIDRTAGTPGWLVVKPFVTDTSNCILPAYVIRELAQQPQAPLAAATICDAAYSGITGSIVHLHLSDFGITNFDPSSPNATNNGAGPAPNNGAGFYKDLGGNELPSAPHFTTSLSAEYTMPVSEDWAATLHSDFYWQSQSFARIFNDRPYDKIRGYSNVNLALILTSANGWQVMGYLKNVFDTTAITGAFLNSDDTALSTNIFTTDPRLFGVRVTKNW